MALLYWPISHSSIFVIADYGLNVADLLLYLSCILYDIDIKFD